jgi:hypothetical protein
MSQKNKPSAENSGKDTKSDIQTSKESVYDKIPLTIKQLDILIIILIITIVVAFILGVRK